MVYEDLFRAQSPFFEAALGRDFIEAETRVVKLREHTPEAFDVYLRWVCSHRVFIPGKTIGLARADDDSEDENAKTVEKETKYFSIVCRAYILGDVLQDSDFKDALIDAFIEEVSSCFSWPTKEAKYVYDNTIKDANLCRVLAEMAAGRMGLRVLAECGDAFFEDAAQKYGTVDSSVTC